ncbi:MAG: NAD(P)/FAD-dependent oxidoreductase [bacterium]|nr:NAD(P)/FAD-dependent oxidoreductase [bacterium]
METEKRYKETSEIPVAAVIGGGAAAMMAAVALKETCPRARVLLFEKNHHLGAKVIISGGGRCNVTTGREDPKDLVSFYPRGGKYLLSAFYHFPPRSVMDWFEDHGVPLKIEEDLRVFPRSNDGDDVVGALSKTLSSLGAEVLLRSAVQSVERVGEKFLITYGQTSSSELSVDGVVVATGGNAYRRTGSTGDGYAFAKALGHSVTPLAASLHAFVAAQPWVKELAGVSWQQAGITLNSSDGARNYHFQGPFVFTHQGISGPAIFALSSLSAYEEFSPQRPLTLYIDFFPELRKEELAQRWRELTDQHRKKQCLNVVDMFLPRSLSGILLRELAIPPDRSIAELSKAHQEKILQSLKGFSLSLVGKMAGEEFVTAGGVPLEEVDPRTMASKICPGLSFAGEVLDIDGFTGGYNLQAAWATGRLAGESLGNMLTQSD